MIGLGVLVFLLAFGAGVGSKLLPTGQEGFATKWTDDLGTLQMDLPYGDGEANTFDLYLPKDTGKKAYGLVVYLHAGGFTAGDKTDDRGILSWLTKKGYVAAGINYTLAKPGEEGSASVLSQSEEIKAAIPQVIEAAQKAGYSIDKMTVAGGSAGHALAMIYTYRDGKDAPVPVVLTFGAVGPSTFQVDYWDIFGLDKDTAEAHEAGAGLMSVMSGQTITAAEIADGSYMAKLKPISAAEWVAHNPVPTVVAYGQHDKVQPFAASQRLEQVLKENRVDYKYHVLPHSGHGMQNDDKIAKAWLDDVETYLKEYMKID